LVFFVSEVIANFMSFVKLRLRAKTTKGQGYIRTVSKV